MKYTFTIQKEQRAVENIATCILVSWTHDAENNLLVFGYHHLKSCRHSNSFLWHLYGDIHEGDIDPFDQKY